VLDEPRPAIAAAAEPAGIAAAERATADQHALLALERSHRR
jgi:hypothetical protein